MDIQQHPLALSFTDKSLEADYLEIYFQKTLNQARIALILGATLYALFAVLDVWIVPEKQPDLWLLRFAFVIPLLLLIWLLSFTPYFKPNFQIFMGFASLIGGGGVLGILNIAATEDINHFFYGIALILVIIWSFSFSGLRFLYACISCFTFILLFELFAIFIHPHPWYIFVNNNFYIISSLVISMFAGYTVENYSRQDFLKTRIIDEERKANEKLLLNILPPSVTEKLKKKPGTIAERFESISILFADIVGFTNLATHMKPTEVVELLNQIFSSFDELIDRYGLEKIKTIGDAYMAAGGLQADQNNHAEAIANLALDMQKKLIEFNAKTPYEFDIRIGIHTGPAVAGVIGTKKFFYDIWGDSVNTASRMESQGLPGQIQTSQETYQLLKDNYSFKERGTISVKGKGPMKTYLLQTKESTSANVD